MEAYVRATVFEVGSREQSPGINRHGLLFHLVWTRTDANEQLVLLH